MSSRSEEYAAHVRAFSELPVRLRSEPGDDLDKVVILPVIAEGHHAAIEALKDPDAGASDPAAAPGRCGVNAHPVALCAGIRRATVRRKIAAVIDKDRVACHAAGSLSPTARAAEDRAEGTAATVKYIRSVGCAERI